MLDSPHVRFALAVRREYAADNAAGFFRLVRSKRCSFLQACCLHKYFDKMRVRTLEVVNKTLNKAGAVLWSATITFDVVYSRRST